MSTIAKAVLVSCGSLLFVSCSDAPGGGSIGGSGKIDIAPNPAYVVGNVESITDLVIDGQRFDTEQTSFIVNGEAGALSDLRIGMSVNAEVDYLNQNASKIEYQSIVAGPINTVSDSGDTLDVLGQQIVLSETTYLDEITTEDLFEGAVIEVSGDRDTDNSIIADYIRHRNVADSYFIVGKINVSPAVNEPVTISGTTVDFDSLLEVISPERLSELESGTTINAEIVIQNTVQENSLVVADIKVVSEVPLNDYEVVMVKGVATSVEVNQYIVVRDFVFQINSETEYLDRRGAAIEPERIVANSGVQITGLTLSNNTVIAEKVVLKHTARSKRSRNANE